MQQNDVRYPWEEPEQAAGSSTGGSETVSDTDRGADESGERAAGTTERSIDAAAVEAAVPRSDGEAIRPAEPDGAQTNAAAHPGSDDESDPADEPAATSASVPKERPIAPKEYYAISEVCDLVDLKPHVLRYWETQFAVLNPSKNRSGNRVYQRKEIKLILLVKHLLYDEKYTVEGAKQKLEQLRRSGELGATTRRALDAGAIEMLQTELQTLSELLTVPEAH